jgi:elongation factor Ts
MATLDQVKELRNRTGCGIVDCKQALDESKGDVEEAINILRKKGVAKAAKKADRDTREGTIASYVHSNGKIATLVSVLCETDFVARNQRFQQLARDIAMHIAATDPVVVHSGDMPAEAIEAERAIAIEQAKNSNKPPEIQAKIVDGKLKAFAEERALMSQPFVKDPSKTIQQLVNEAIQELGENISVGDFHRLSV